MPSQSQLLRPLPAIGRVLWIVVGGLLGMLASMVTLVGSHSAVPLYQPSTSIEGETTDIGVLVLLLWFLATASLFVRGRLPWLVVIAGGILTLFLRLDSLLLLLGAGSVVLRRDRRQAIIVTAVAAALSLAAGLRDGLRPWGDTAWQIMFASESGVESTPEPLFQLGISLAIALVACVVVLGTAWLVRLRRDLNATGQAREEAESRSESLETTAFRLEERERLAQEVHDALSHRLSVIALHSGALGEAVKDADPGVSRSAAVLRENAHRSLEDLRDLVGALREPAGTGRPAAAEEPPRMPPIGLSALPDLIGSARASGAWIQANVMVQDAEKASELLNRAAYRITQEALTNAYKHAPGQPVYVDVTASPGEGVHIRVANGLGADSGLPGSGSGLVGMRERADVLNGRFSAGPDGRGGFVVQADLPWQARSDDGLREQSAPRQ